MNRAGRTGLVAACLAAAGFCSLATGQEGTEPAVDPDIARAGEAMLRAQASQSRGVAVLTAAYVQRRTTKLAKEPLQSRGEFLFVRDPACVVFRATEPRVSVIRLRANTYEVYRPQKKQLERFLLDGPELAQGLFAALGGDADRLLRDFSVRACAADPADPARTLVVLAPRALAVRERLLELRLSLRTQEAELVAVSYRDAAGDLIEIELREPVRNPAKAPSTELDVPADAAIVEHAPPKKTG